VETALGVGRRPPAFWASTGLKATLSAVVELAEYPTFLKSSDQLVAAYEDTLGDLALSLIGSSLAALVGVRRPRSETKTTQADAGSAVALAKR
jgi:hypothetical protein